MSDQPPLDQIDRLVLNCLQGGFPAVPRPYAFLAEKLNLEHQLNLNENELHRRVSDLKKNGYIRRLGAIFDARALGYQSTLCAARVPEGKLEAFAALVNASPAVTHNYLRSGDLNVWFTFTAKTKSDLEQFIGQLKTDSGLEEIFLLPAEKPFKIKVNFNLNQSVDLA